MRSRVRWILTASTFTLGIAIGIIASYYFGSWVDARYGTGSVFSTLLVLVAIVGGFYNLYRYVSRQLKNLK
ncbi:MAG TPA: AtpZ/AtpI family protein [Firmicutes bacterium]|jgi:branched-subunit amino acid ABC-type transport system permease component|nr:AtpZ/AtpI family protein [Bacillota bacterium]